MLQEKSASTLEYSMNKKSWFCLWWHKGLEQITGTYYFVKLFITKVGSQCYK